MRLKVLRAFYGDEKGVKAGDIINVSDARGRQLIQRKLAEHVAEPAQKADHAADNKQAKKPENKAAVANNAKAK